MEKNSVRLAPKKAVLLTKLYGFNIQIIEIIPSRVRASILQVEETVQCLWPKNFDKKRTFLHSISCSLTVTLTHFPGTDKKRHRLTWRKWIIIHRLSDKIARQIEFLAWGKFPDEKNEISFYRKTFLVTQLSFSWTFWKRVDSFYSLTT